jgi:hypothetical protein
VLCVDGRWESAVVPFVNSDFYTSQGVKPDQYWFPYSSEMSIWLDRDEGTKYSCYPTWLNVVVLLLMVVSCFQAFT